MHTAGQPYLGLAHGVRVKAGNEPRRLLHPGLSTNLRLSWQVQGDMVLWDYVDEQCGHNLERKRRQSWWKEEKLRCFLLGPLVFLNPERQTTPFWWAVGKAEKKKKKLSPPTKGQFLVCGTTWSQILLCDLCIMYSMWETIKKAEHWRTEAFKLWCWRRLLRVPWIARGSNQSVLKEINPEFIGRTDAEAPKLWPPDMKTQLIGNDPDAWKDWGQEKRVTEDEMVG